MDQRQRLEAQLRSAHQPDQAAPPSPPKGVQSGIQPSREPCRLHTRLHSSCQALPTPLFQPSLSGMQPWTWCQYWISMHGAALLMGWRPAAVGEPGAAEASTSRGGSGGGGNGTEGPAANGAVAGAQPAEAAVSADESYEVRRPLRAGERGEVMFVAGGQTD